jgi:hypothetical protein
MVDVPEEPNFGEEDLMVLEPPEEEPNALSQEDAEMMNDPDLLRELEEFQPIASHLPAKTVPDVPIPDFGDDDDIIFPTPPSSTGVVPSKPTNQFTPPKPAATKTFVNSFLAAINSNNQIIKWKFAYTQANQTDEANFTNKQLVPTATRR